MSAIIINEYKELLLQKNKIEQILPSLPEGYISKKTIKEKQYYYLQNRIDGKIRSRYLKKNEIDAIKEFLRIAENREIISEGDQVEILNGAMESKKGEVLKIEGERAILYLEELGAKIYVSLSDVNKVNDNQNGL